MLTIIRCTTMFDDAPRGTQHCSFQPSCALAEHNCKTAIKVETTIDQTIGCQNSLHRVLLSCQTLNPEDFGAGLVRSAAGEYVLATSRDFTLLHCWVWKSSSFCPRGTAWRDRGMGLSLSSGESSAVAPAGARRWDCGSRGWEPTEAAQRRSLRPGPARAAGQTRWSWDPLNPKTRAP